MKKQKNSTRQALQARAGEHIRTYIRRLIESKCRLGFFNGLRFYALSLTEQCFLTEYNAAKKRKSRKLKKDYQYQKLVKQERLASRHATREKKTALLVLMELSLPELNFKDHNAVLDWLYLYFKATDTVDIMENHSHDVVIKKLEENGYVAGVNTGEKYIAEDEKNNALYLIGQFLKCIKKHGCCPDIFGDFYSQYCAKFRYPAESTVVA